MKTYRGYAYDHSVTVQVDYGDEHPLVHHVLHSPDGFMWGYSGSGPSELARCILLDHFGLPGDADVLPVSYMEFKAEVLAKFPMESNWVLTSNEIDKWSGMAAGP